MPRKRYKVIKEQKQRGAEWPVNLFDDVLTSEGEPSKEALTILSETGSFGTYAVACQLARLTSREELALSLYYRENQTYEEIGEIFGVTRQRVCDLVHSAIKKLKTPLPSTILRYGLMYYVRIVVEEEARAHALREFEKYKTEFLANFKNSTDDFDNIKHAIYAGMVQDVKGLGLSEKTENSLKSAGFSTVGDLVRLVQKQGYRAIGGIRGIGPVKADQIIRAVKLYADVDLTKLD